MEFSCGGTPCVGLDLAVAVGVQLASRLDALGSGGFVGSSLLAWFGSFMVVALAGNALGLALRVKYFCMAALCARAFRLRVAVVFIIYTWSVVLQGALATERSDLTLRS